VNALSLVVFYNVHTLEYISKVFVVFYNVHTLEYISRVFVVFYNVHTKDLGISTICHVNLTSFNITSLQYLEYFMI